MFISALISAILTFAACHLAEVAGQATYCVLNDFMQYAIIAPEEGYFVDHPDDQEIKLSWKTAIKRLKIYKEDARVRHQLAMEELAKKQKGGN